MQTSIIHRWLGIAVAKNPGLVLSIAVGIMFIMCLGLFFLKVETDPEKVI